MPRKEVGMNAPDPLLVHYTQSPPAPPDNPLAAEDATYRREVGRLLAEGYEGKHVLIKGDTILGIYGTDAEALAEGRKRFLTQPFLVGQIRTWEPVSRCLWRYFCPT
jgi:hypothetical protein